MTVSSGAGEPRNLLPVFQVVSLIPPCCFDVAQSVPLNLQVCARLLFCLPSLARPHHLSLARPNLITIVYSYTQEQHYIGLVLQPNHCASNDDLSEYPAVWRGSGLRLAREVRGCQV